MTHLRAVIPEVIDDIRDRMPFLLRLVLVWQFTVLLLAVSAGTALQQHCRDVDAG